jgi:hypothetical protein
VRARLWIAFRRAQRDCNHAFSSAKARPGLEVIFMSSRFSAGAAALIIILAAGHASAAAQDQKPSAKPQKVSGAAKSAAQIRFAPLGATVESVLAAGRQLNPALRAAALDTSAAAAKAAGADALDDPMISDSYQY